MKERGVTMKILKRIYAYVDLDTAVKKKIYTLIAGINGSGKSSITNVLQNTVGDFGHVINPDALAAQNGSSTIKAGKEALEDIKTCIENGVEFSQETTLSSNQVIKSIDMAKSAGYTIRMFYVGISTAEESLKRIKNRVEKGGHDIPEDAVRRRYQKRYENLNKVLPLCDVVEFYDNENGFTKVAEYKNDCIKIMSKNIPVWLQEFLELYAD